MQERLIRAQNLVYVGLFVVLASAVFSASGSPLASPSIFLSLVTVGGGLALAGRLWLSYLQKQLRQRDPHFGMFLTR